MVLVRRRDNRRGKETEEITVASDASIVANKGVRSLGVARTGRFAADMRVSMGGYGRADKTWGVDHPWHSTEAGDLFAQMCAKDCMEEGTLDDDAMHEEPLRGLSRAQLKKRKAKLKKQGLSAHQAAKEALKEAEASRLYADKEKRMLEEQEIKRREEIKKNRQQKKSLEQTQEMQIDEEKAAAKKDLRKKALQKKAFEKKEAIQQVQQQIKLQEQEIRSREVLASAYEENMGSEVTSKSGLVLQDRRIGHGKLPVAGDMLTVKYRGRLGCDGLIFGKGMLTMTYGAGSVIAGWEEGLGTMRPGGFRLLTIPSELGYGESGKGDKIPPNSTLFFEVELVRIGKRKREIVGDDDVPLPNSFQRKRIKQKPGKKHGDDEKYTEIKLSKSQIKRRRRKRNEGRNDAAVELDT